MPSGASTGIYEALELRDGDKQRYLGKGEAFSLFQTLPSLSFILLPHTSPQPPSCLRPTSGPSQPDPVWPLCLSPGVLKAVDHINTTIAPALISSVRPALCWGRWWAGPGSWKQSWMRGGGREGRFLLGIILLEESVGRLLPHPCSQSRQAAFTETWLAAGQL